ncbi:MAG: ATP-binding protein [Chromatiaceae bacterium]
MGPNASGKSSLLDAIQAVLVGGDKRRWNPNASAGEKSTRSLRDYCLGVVRDPGNPDLSQEFRPRDQAISYLALVFRDDQTGDATSIGLALHARLDEPQEVIDGRIIAPGLDLVLSDLVDRTPRPRPQALEALKAQFDRDQAAHYRKQAEKAAIQDLRERQLMPLNDRLRGFPDLVGLTAPR